MAEDLENFEGDDAAEEATERAEKRAEAHSTYHGVVFTKNKLAKVIGMAPMTLEKMIRDGMPVKAKGSRTTAWEMNSADCIDWLRKRDIQLATGDEEALSFDAAKRRDKEAQAKLRELQIGEREGKLIEVTRVVDYMGKMLGAVRSRIFAVRGQVPGLTAEQEDQLNDALVDALTELSGDTADDWLEGDVGTEEDFEGDDGGDGDSSFESFEGDSEV